MILSIQTMNVNFLSILVSLDEGIEPTLCLSIMSTHTDALVTRAYQSAG